jgi:hypothetical protein
MADVLTDKEIQQLLKEPKLLPEDYRTRIQIRPKIGHKERELDIRGESGSDFRLILRQSIYNHLDFSVILAYRPSNSNQLFRLCRCNGKSHEHTNTIEQEKFYDFHIHRATERYQQIGAREDAYADPTDKYSDIHEAVTFILKEGGFEIPKNTQRSLFDGV